MSIDDGAVGGMRAVHNTAGEWFRTLEHSFVIAMASVVTSEVNTQALSLKWAILVMTLVFALHAVVSYWKGELCRAPKHSNSRRMYYLMLCIHKLIGLLAHFSFYFVTYLSITTLKAYVSATTVWTALAEVSIVLIVMCGVFVFVCVHREKRD